jgi:hypothetical protein
LASASNTCPSVLGGAGFGVRGGQEDRHRAAFNEAFSDAVTKYAAMRSGRPTEGQKLSVTLSIVVSVENPGRIEGYVVDVG